SKKFSPLRHGPQSPSIAGAGSPHLVQNGGSSRTRLDQHWGHAAAHRRSRTGARQTTHVAGKIKLRMKSIKRRSGKTQKAGSVYTEVKLGNWKSDKSFLEAARYRACASRSNPKSEISNWTPRTARRLD